MTNVIGGLGLIVSKIDCEFPLTWRLGEGFSTLFLSDIFKIWPLSRFSFRHSVTFLACSVDFVLVIF